ESLNKTVRLPDAVRIGNESFKIRYDKAYVERNGFGQVLIHIPIDVPLFRTLPACFHVYSRAIGGKQHLVYNVTETRWYKIRRRIEGLYNITYLDLETGETHSVLTSLSLGVYPEFGIAGGPSQTSFPSFLLKYFPEYANLTSIPPGTMIDFERSTPSFLVAVPGHYEDIDVLVPEHEEKFRVLFPAYDPVWLTGWLVEASLSSSNVETGDILEVSYVATPIDINPEEQPLNATLTLHYSDGFQPLDSVQRRLNNTHAFGSFKLKAIAPGTYVLTLKLEGNAFFPGWPPPDEVSYTVNVVGPESPRVEVSLEGGAPFFKHVNITARLENKGSGEALNTILEFAGDVEPLSISVGSIPAGGSWSKVVTLRLRSEVASIRARATFFDSSGSKYVSEGFATVVSPAYVVPEHFEEYTLRVPEHFEKRRVFVPGYEGYTHIKIYHPYSAFEIPGSFTISFQGLILEAEGVKVYTSFLPIADEGFELRVIPKEVTLNIYGDVLVGPLIPVQGLQTTVPVKYMVKSVEPAFEEKMLREDEAGSILKVTGSGELENMGKALAKVGDSFENGLKLFETYFKTLEVEQYGKNIANTLVEAVSKNVDVLEIWKNAVEEELKILVDVSTRGDGDLNIEGKVGTDRRQIFPGYYWIQVISEDSGREVNEGLRNIGPPEGTMGLLHFEGVKGGDKYILILGSVTVENFLDRVKVKYTDATDKLRKGTVGDWLKDMYGLSGTSFVRDGGSIYLMIGGEKVAKVDAALAGTSSRIYFEFKIAEPDGGEHIFHIGWRDGEATFDIILGKHHCPVMGFTQKAVRDSGGGVVARLLYVKYLETTEAGYREANTNFPVNREGFDWWSPEWSFSNTFITDEGIINIKTDSAWLQGPLKDIFGEEVLRKLESVGVKVALAYQHEGETALKFTKSSDLSVRDLPEGSNAIGFLVLRMDKEPSMRIGEVEINFGSLAEKTRITYSRDLTITKGSYSRTLQADVMFTSPEGILVVKTESGNLEILRKFWCDSDMKSIVYEDFVRMGDVEAAISNVIRFEILSDVPCLGDIALVQYAKDGETYNMVGGLTKELPETFTGIRSRATSHAWLIANYLKYELDKGYTEGWRIDDVEVNYKGMRFDVIATRPDERKAIMEFKTIFEPNDADDLIKQAGRYLDVCTKEDSGFAELVYVFQVDQNGKIPKGDVKALYNALNDFLATGRLRLTDGKVILDTSPEKAGRILKILTYAGGYVP
ncbi:MAG: hypothetical protein QXU11_07115, partial [Thermoproteota archaeon]